MKISEMVMNQKQFLYVLAKLIEGTEAYLSCRNLLLSGIKLIGNDDLMHGLDDLRKALEMLLKKKLHSWSNIMAIFEVYFSEISKCVCKA